jgi:hypothetical protein
VATPTGVQLGNVEELSFGEPSAKTRLIRLVADTRKYMRCASVRVHAKQWSCSLAGGLFAGPLIFLNFVTILATVLFG